MVSHQQQAKMGLASIYSTLKSLALLLLLCCASTQLVGQAEESWKLFENAVFKDIYLEEYGAYASLLEDTPDIVALNETQITIRGYHIPVMEDELIILSKYPNANCFFCGGAGLESILEVRMIEKPSKRFEMDEKLTFSGRLIVNTTDHNLVSFILEDAILIER